IGRRQRLTRPEPKAQKKLIRFARGSIEPTRQSRPLRKVSLFRRGQVQLARGGEVEGFEQRRIDGSRRQGGRRRSARFQPCPLLGCRELGRSNGPLPRDVAAHDVAAPLQARSRDVAAAALDRGSREHCRVELSAPNGNEIRSRGFSKYIFDILRLSPARRNEE